MDDVLLDVDCWLFMIYFKEKCWCDEVFGSNFKMMIIGFDSLRLVMFMKILWKCQSIGNFIQYLFDLELLRLFIVVEYVCVKGVDLELVCDVGMIFGYEVLGQVVFVLLFMVVFKYFGSVLLIWKVVLVVYWVVVFCLLILKVVQ